MFFIIRLSLTLLKTVLLCLLLTHLLTKCETIQRSIVILGLIVGRLADAVQLGILLALLGACCRDHLLLLGLGRCRGLPLLLPFPLVCGGDPSGEVVLRADAVRVRRGMLLLVVGGGGGSGCCGGGGSSSLGGLLGCSLSSFLLPSYSQEVPLQLLLRSVMSGQGVTMMNFSVLTYRLVSNTQTHFMRFVSSFVPGSPAAALYQEGPSSSGSPS